MTIRPGNRPLASEPREQQKAEYSTCCMCACRCGITGRDPMQALTSALDRPIALARKTLAG